MLENERSLRRLPRSGTKIVAKRIVVGVVRERSDRDRKAKASGDEIESEKSVRAILAGRLLLIRASIDHRSCEERVLCAVSLRHALSRVSRDCTRFRCCSRRCDIAADVRGTKRVSRAVARSRVVVS